MSRRRVRRNTDNAGVGVDVGGDSAVVQASLLASLTAASISPWRVAIVGIPFTAASSYYGSGFAVGAAALHLIIILALNDVAPYPIQAVMAGLLGGCVLSYRVAAATLFGALIIAALLVTAVELDISLWVMGVPAVAIGSLVGGVTFLTMQSRSTRKSKTSNYGYAEPRRDDGRVAMQVSVVETRNLFV